MSTNQLIGKVAVVTGASKGIGAAIAKDLAAAGASVVVNYASSREGADRVVAEITGAGGRAIAVQADLSKPDQVASLFAATKREFGRVDILVNNAGIYEWAPLEQITPESFHRQFDLNVLGLILAVKEASPLFPEEGGSVINISSTVSTARFPGGTVYTATKGAVDAVTRVLAAELGPRKIRVNSVNPGMVDTEGAQSAGFIGSDMQKGIEAITPLGRIGKPEDISGITVFLAGPESSWITGESFFISGGMR
jgi:3-oxoacyl-[acyl-carrier protein] reductase